MLLLVVRSNEYVVNVDKRIGEVLQDVIHQLLECLSSVGETERHSQELEQTERRDDRHLVNVLGCHLNLLITLS